MPFARPEIEKLRQNGITRVALPRMHDKDIIPLWFGEGDEVTEPFIREAAKTALDAGDTFYCHTQGKLELRQAVARYLNDLYGIALDTNRITVPGSTMLGITIAAQMALGRGDHALIVSPHWPNIENTLQVCGAEISTVRQRLEDGRWQLSAEEIAAATRATTRAIFVNTPCNPTGWMMEPAEQRKLLEFCRSRRILIIADEVYHRTVFEGRAAPSFLEIAEPDDPVISVGGFSKAWAMTGWRIGWMVAPSMYAEQLSAISECFNTGATVFTQPAAIAALEQGEPVVERLRQSYAQGLELVMRYLGQHPDIELSRPEGAFYVFPRIPGLSSSLTLAERLADEEKVGVAPGYTFGPDNEEFFRLCFAESHERLEEALKRIVRFIDGAGPDLIDRSS